MFGCLSDVAVRPGQILMQTYRKLKALMLVLLEVWPMTSVFSDVTTGDPDNNGGVISKLSDGVGAAGDVAVRKFNIQSQRVQSTQVP